MLNLTSLLDQLLPKAFHTQCSGDELFRARITSGVTAMYFVSLVFVIVLLLLFTYLGYVEVWSAVISCSISSSCYLFQLIYFKKTGNLFIASTITILTLFGATCSFVTLTGGWQSPVVLFLFVVPMCAFLMMGHKPGIFWTGLAATAYLILGVFEYFSVPMPHVVAAEYEHLLKLFSWMFSWTIIVGGVSLYSGVVNSLNEAVNEEREKMRIKATFDEETGAYTRKAFQQLLKQKNREAALNTQSPMVLFCLELEFSQRDQLLEQAQAFHDVLDKLRATLGEEIILSRYGGLSITGLITPQPNSDIAHAVTHDIYSKLQMMLDEHGATVYMGAVFMPGFSRDVNTLTQGARKALYIAKQKNRKLVIFAKSLSKAHEQDYIGEVVRARFDQVVAEA